MHQGRFIDARDSLLRRRRDLDARTHVSVRRKRPAHIAGGWGNHIDAEIYVSASLPLLIRDNAVLERPEGSTSPRLSNSPAPPNQVSFTTGSRSNIDETGNSVFTGCICGSSLLGWRAEKRCKRAFADGLRRSWANVRRA